jgi:hypothetical protein
MELSKLLPRLLTSRQWTQAEAIQLLDDVAYYAPDLLFARAGTAAKASEAKLGPGKVPEAPSVDSLNPSSDQ